MDRRHIRRWLHADLCGIRFCLSSSPRWRRWPDGRRGGRKASSGAGARAVGSAATEEAEPPTEGPVVGVVGPCGAGKSTLVKALRRRGVRAREVAQEHSYVPAMWRRIARPDVLVYLTISREEAERRLRRGLPAGWWKEILQRLSHARSHADLVVPTDGRTPEEVLEEVLSFLTEHHGQVVSR